MLLCGLTGSIGCGKSTAVRYFLSRSVKVIDADQIAREIVQPGKPAYIKLRQEFGAQFFNDENGGVLLREKLGELVFSNHERRHKLNSITHPEIRKQMLLQILRAFFSGDRFIILDIPLLFESGTYWFIQKIIVIHCTPDKQLERICQRDTLNEEQARARMNSQLPNEYKMERATFCVDNNGTIEETNQQLEKIVEQLNASWFPFVVRTIIVSGVSALSWIVVSRFI